MTPLSQWWLWLGGSSLLSTAKVAMVGTRTGHRSESSRSRNEEAASHSSSHALVMASATSGATWVGSTCPGNCRAIPLALRTGMRERTAVLRTQRHLRPRAKAASGPTSSLASPSNSVQSTAFCSSLMSVCCIVRGNFCSNKSRFQPRNAAALRASSLRGSDFRLAVSCSGEQLPGSPEAGPSSPPWGPLPGVLLPGEGSSVALERNWITSSKAEGSGFSCCERCFSSKVSSSRKSSQETTTGAAGIEGGADSSSHTSITTSERGNYSFATAVHSIGLDWLLH
uniref:Secreted protein n=1 Tax=Ixodes ricinus TaxID=34613 RepID=A0A147BDX3_IXORI